MAWEWVHSTSPEYSQGLLHALEHMAEHDRATLVEACSLEEHEQYMMIDSLAQAAHDEAVKHDTSTNGGDAVYLPDGWTTVTPWDRCESCYGYFAKLDHGYLGNGRMPHCSNCKHSCSECGEDENSAE